jgi:hypothetical protein
LIGVFKPKPVENSSNKGKSKAGKGKSVSKAAMPADGRKPKPTRSQLGREIWFDLTLTRYSILMDIISNLLITATPAPWFHHTNSGGVGVGQSQTLFVLASGMACFGTGAGPAVHSLTLCILQAREMGDEHEEAQAAGEGTRNVGALFGAFAFLQSIASMILGVRMFQKLFVFEG